VLAAALLLATGARAQCSFGATAQILDNQKIVAMNGAACRVITATSFTLHPMVTQAQLQLPWLQQVTGALSLSDNRLVTSLVGEQPSAQKAHVLQWR
jgi:hypothetical protein